MGNRTTGTFDPARDGMVIAPHNTNPLDTRIKALWANTAGTLVWDGETGSDLTLVVNGPGPIPVVPKRVKVASSFTAGQLLGLFG